MILIWSKKSPVLGDFFVLFEIEFTLEFAPCNAIIVQALGET